MTASDVAKAGTVLTAYLCAVAGWLLGTIYVGFWSGFSIGVASGLLGAPLGGLLGACVAALFSRYLRDETPTTESGVATDDQDETGFGEPLEGVEPAHP